jgi:hypothetical protein
MRSQPISMHRCAGAAMAHYHRDSKGQQGVREKAHQKAALRACWSFRFSPPELMRL